MAGTPLSKTVLQEAVNAVAKCGGNQSHAAVALGISRNTLMGRLDNAKRQGIKAGKAIDNPEDIEQVKLKLKRTEQELRKTREENLTESSVRNEILKISDSVATAVAPNWALTSKHAGTPGVPTLFVSDLHWGEVVKETQINGVNKYDLRIAHQRLGVLAEKTVGLLKIISPEMDYPGLVLVLGGDMITGNIHDELTATNQLNTMPTLLDLYGGLVWLIGTMADQFGHIFLPCVTGNHGRDTHKIWNKDRHATSFDWLLYGFLAKHFEADDRITFYIPDGPDAYYRVFGHRYLLSHGDQFRGGDGLIGSLGPITRGDHKKRSRNTQIEMDYDTMLLGHFHQYMHLTRFIVNGSLKGYDEYAYNNNFGFEVPQQALWLTHPKHGITFRMPVHLSEARGRVVEAEWVSVPR